MTLMITAAGITQGIILLVLCTNFGESISHVKRIEDIKKANAYTSAQPWKLSNLSPQLQRRPLVRLAPSTMARKTKKVRNLGRHTARVYVVYADSSLADTKLPESQCCLRSNIPSSDRSRSVSDGSGGASASSQLRRRSNKLQLRRRSTHLQEVGMLHRCDGGRNNAAFGTSVSKGK